MRWHRSVFWKKTDSILRKISIKMRLWIMFAVQMFILLTALWAILASSLDDTFSTIQANNAQVLTVLSNELEKATAALNTATQFPIIYNEDNTTQYVYNYLTAPENYQVSTYEYEFESACRSLFYSFPQISLVSLLNADGEGYLRRNDIAYSYNLPDWSSITSIEQDSSAGWMKNALSHRGTLQYWNAQPLQSLFPDNNDGWIYATRSVYNITEHRNVGLTLVGVDLSDARSYFEKNANYSEDLFYVFDEQDQYFWGNLPDTAEAIHPDTYGKETNYRQVRGAHGTALLSSIALPSGFQLYIQTPYSLIYGTAFREQFAVCLILVLVSLVIMISTNALVRSITKPITRLMHACDKLGDGRLSTTIEDRGNDEFSALAGSFNSMSRENKRLIDEVYEKDLLKSKLEIQMLREQINPHFLYNTLDSIRSAAALKGEPELAQMSYLLAQNLRYGVSKTSPLVTVEEELANLSQYIELQKLHYHDKLRFEVHVDPALFPLQIIRLLLQPVVENAIIHGISPAPYADTITLLGSLQEDVLIFQVSDNGIGMDLPQLHLLTDYVNGKNDAFKSIGLKNIQRRIHLYYGEEYGMSFLSSPGRGMLVTLTVPADPITKGEDADAKRPVS